MSYILDALEKSEQERKQGEVPGLNTFQDQIRPSRSPHRRLFYLLIGILLPNILIITLWLFFREPPAPAQVPTTTSASTATPTGDASPVVTTTTIAETSQPQEVDNNSAPISETTEMDQQSQPEITTKQDSSPAPTQEIENIAESELTEIEEQPGLVALENSDIKDEELYDIQEKAEPVIPALVSFENLPEDIRSDLPELNIAAHYFSNNPSARMASINGRIMRQGQTITRGLIIEEITREGVIFSFRKHRFILKVFSR